jgi:hypothetical protein
MEEGIWVVREKSCRSKQIVLEIGGRIVRKESWVGCYDEGSEF